MLMQIPEGILGAARFELPSWTRITGELLDKLNSPVLLCTSLEDSVEDIQYAAKLLPPSLLLHISAEHAHVECLSAGTALQAAQAVQADCRLLGSLPEVCMQHTAMIYKHLLHSVAHSVSDCRPLSHHLWPPFTRSKHQQNH